MGVERGVAIRTDDAQVLESVVVSDTVDVIEDKRHASAVPQLAEAADLTSGRLQPLGKQPSLEMVAGISRVLDHDLGQRNRRLLDRGALHRVRIEVRRRDCPKLHVLEEDRARAARMAHTEATKGLRVTQ
ncbi:MAG: hypothetical protein M3459_07830 [Actinomycetota bacterium]|nr:hypothetical protein [Actinomycetota bacterium]